MCMSVTVLHVARGPASVSEFHGVRTDLDIFGDM